MNNEQEQEINFEKEVLQRLEIIYKAIMEMKSERAFIGRLGVPICQHEFVEVPQTIGTSSMNTKKYRCRKCLEERFTCD